MWFVIAFIKPILCFMFMSFLTPTSWNSDWVSPFQHLHISGNKMKLQRTWETGISSILLRAVIVLYRTTVTASKHTSKDIKWQTVRKNTLLVLGPHFHFVGIHYQNNANEKSAWKHCKLAVVRWSQKFSPRRRPPSRGRRTAKIQSAGGGHYLHLQTQFGEDLCTQFQTHTPTDTHKQKTHRQDLLQYTALQLASAQCNYIKTG